MVGCKKLFALSLVGTLIEAETLVPKDDPNRIVGKVLQIDREQGIFRLATEEGVLIVQAPPQALQAVKVGDTVSVPRPATEPPSAPPRR